MPFGQSLSSASVAPFPNGFAILGAAASSPDQKAVYTFHGATSQWRREFEVEGAMESAAMVMYASRSLFERCSRNWRGLENRTIKAEDEGTTNAGEASPTPGPLNTLSSETTSSGTAGPPEARIDPLSLHLTINEGTYEHCIVVKPGVVNFSRTYRPLPDGVRRRVGERQDH